MRRPSAAPIEIAVVPKPGGAVRRLVTLDEPDLRAYERAVAAVLPTIERALGPDVLANRARVLGGRLQLRPFPHERRRYRERIDRLARGPARVAVVGDVRDCYGSISLRAIDRCLRRLGACAEEITAVVDLLSGFEARGVRGLPVGPTPSAPLANAVLASVDDAIAAASGARPVRWVDDIAASAADRAAAGRILDAFVSALAELGLEPNEAKTGVVTDLGAIGTSTASDPGSAPVA